MHIPCPSGMMLDVLDLTRSDRGSASTAAFALAEPLTLCLKPPHLIRVLYGDHYSVFETRHTQLQSNNPIIQSLVATDISRAGNDRVFELLQHTSYPSEGFVKEVGTGWLFKLCSDANFVIVAFLVLHDPSFPVFGQVRAISFPTAVSESGVSSISNFFGDAYF